VSGYARQRAKERIAELASQGHDLVTFWREATDAIAPAIPFYLTPCFYTLDPASLLATSHYHDGLPEIPHEWLAVEYYEPDYNKMADVARSARGVATLQDATGGDVSRSAKYRVSMEPAAQQLLVTPERPYKQLKPSRATRSSRDTKGETTQPAAVTGRGCRIGTPARRRPTRPRLPVPAMQHSGAADLAAGR
jgi:hypothetical protein